MKSTQNLYIYKLILTDVNEINDQLEKQHDDIRALENEIQIYKADAEETIEEKKSKLKDIELVYNQKSSEHGKMELEMQDQERLLEQLRVGIKTIFENTGFLSVILIQASNCVFRLLNERNRASLRQPKRRYRPEHNGLSVRHRGNGQRSRQAAHCHR